jgi:hypothetical protein
VAWQGVVRPVVQVVDWAVCLAVCWVARPAAQPDKVAAAWVVLGPCSVVEQVALQAPGVPWQVVLVVFWNKFLALVQRQRQVLRVKRLPVVAWVICSTVR